MLTLLPSRANARTESVEPMCTKSKHERADPSLAIPKTLMALPKRTKDRSASELPRWKKSRSEKDDAKRTIP